MQQQQQQEQHTMSESSSGLNTSCFRFYTSQSSSCSDLSNLDICLPVLSSRNRVIHQIHQPSYDSGIASPLPSDSFKYLTWHELEEHDVQGSQIHCPRVREGPSEEECFLRGEHHTLYAKKQLTEKEKWEQRLQEDWENCMSLNLSYQDLGDLYQVENCIRILRRLIRVERLWLVDNSLTDLSAICLPRCKELKLSKNHFTSFKQLPKIPEIHHLTLDENNIETLDELSDLRHTPLESLVLERNPCEFQENYRKFVFSKLPNLKVLDGIPKLPEDCLPPETNFLCKICTIL
ncbi:leucine-rich repeat-containing protein 46-like [Anolis sagrei]|uniref:leucine-rich repeat-containing protein 46-like n=1 Tax=Anolis sagrei TaxID=38937 RepID=UPI003522F341